MACPRFKSEPDRTGWAWIAAGQSVFKFDLDSGNLVLQASDALQRVSLVEEEGDVLNEIAVNKTHLAFTTDSGAIGLFDLSASTIVKMRTGHSTVAGSVSFIPNRPRELVSGGYDCAVLHFDYLLASLLSRYDFASDNAEDSQTSLAPPFVHALAISSDDQIACALADGRIWVGSGGKRVAVPSAKKKRKWEGLREEDGSYFQVANGPVVAIAYCDATSIVTTTLTGIIKLHHFPTLHDLDTVWQIQSEKVAKCNACVAQQRDIVVGGVGLDGRGVVEWWAREDEGHAS